jgi:hypothetical protein
MNYKEIIEDLNNDIYEKFGEEAAENGFEYSYETTGYIDIIRFYGIEIFNSENYSIENSDSVEEMSKEDFQDYLEDKVKEIGNNFLKFSFND